MIRSWESEKTNLTDCFPVVTVLLECFRGVRSHYRTSQSRSGGALNIESVITFENSYSDA